MKKVIQITVLAITILCFSYISLISQTIKSEKEKVYKVWVTKMDKSSKTKGYLYETGDSLITIVDFNRIGGSEIVDVSSINEIKFRRKGKTGKGIFLGAIIGISVGAILGFALGNDSGGFLSFSAKEKAFIGGTIMVLPGAIIGGIIGHQMSVKIPIRGNQDTYRKQRERLRDYQLAF